LSVKELKILQHMYLRLQENDNKYKRGIFKKMF
jgi:hypothetical protein